ncbi:Lsr2 family protein [Streptomyces sp. NRRL S-1813]|uniref:Lsr2 family DNA-binding protein n=1 Tax=Streptomyces sp. NRRL S-1813 TaxID=1463888 RepID=UPI00056C375F|nr:Lsr2 family protein [Streptomyces sp. NRRL S-1813]
MAAKETSTSTQTPAKGAKKTAERRTPAKSAQSKVTARPSADAAKNAEMREWAKSVGYENVGSGRVRAEIREAFEKAHTTTDAAPELSADEITARMAKKTAENKEAAEKAVALSRRVVEGAIVGAPSPAALAALEDPKVSEIYNAAKPLVAEYHQVEGRATELLREISRKLIDLRSLFKDDNGRTDWNGNSATYKALADALLREAGIPADSEGSTRRAIGHHIEDRKRECIPAKEHDYYGVQALTRGQRQGLAQRQAKALVEVDKVVKDTKKAKGPADGAQMVVLARKIDAGISAYHETQLAALSPTQRKTFRQTLEETRAKADALLAKLQELETPAAGDTA